jgi:tRNA(Arg) A34 adenosine deaminase TadA
MKPQIISAIVYDKRGRILSTGQNSYTKTHTLQAKIAERVGISGKHFMHAEIAALVKCDWDKAYRIFVSRYGKDGRPLLAKPCRICMAAIEMTSIKKIDYTIGE